MLLTWVRPIKCRRVLHKPMKTRRPGSLETIFKAAYHPQLLEMLQSKYIQNIHQKFGNNLYATWRKWLNTLRCSQLVYYNTLEGK